MIKPTCSWQFFVHSKTMFFSQKTTKYRPHVAMFLEMQYFLTFYYITFDHMLFEFWLIYV